MGTPGTICSPIPQRRHKYIISFHVRTLGDGGGEGQEIKYRKPQKYKRNLHDILLPENTPGSPTSSSPSWLFCPGRGSFLEAVAEFTP